MDTSSSSNYSSEKGELPHVIEEHGWDWILAQKTFTVEMQASQPLRRK
jgi:hypothetical protein